LKKVEKLGERRIIEIIQAHLDQMPAMPVPFGDDVSACELANGNLAVLKTDMLVDKTDVPKGMTLWQAARKAVVMNVSDFAAKGVKPTAMLASLGLPENLTEKDIVEIGEGLNAGAREYGAYIIGGDTGEASDVVIAILLFGMAEKDRLMLRKGANPGDIVAVTGAFGKASAGLKILVNNSKPPEDAKKALVDSVLMPHARLKEGLALCQTKAVSAAIDSSDGLAWSLHELAKASQVGILIESLPIAKEVEKFAVDNKLDAETLALYGGEEYELVLTVKPQLWRKADKAVEKTGGKLLQIGRVTAEKGIMLKIGGKTKPIRSNGYEHFKT
jgi:thiamine-monophosphate kinase